MTGVTSRGGIDIDIDERVVDVPQSLSSSGIITILKLKINKFILTK